MFLKTLALRLHVNRVLSEPQQAEDLLPPPHLIITVLKQQAPPARGICRSSINLQKERWTSPSLFIGQFTLFWS